MLENPLVTVIALCYNHERFLLECLNAIDQQSYPNIELIIFDDASTDRSAHMIEEWLKKTDRKATFIKQMQNGGVCKSLNKALELATGKYVAITATDDCWLTTKIQDQVNYFETLPENVAVVYSDAYVMNEKGTLLEERFIQRFGRLDHFPEGKLFSTLVEGNFIPAMATLVRRKCYTKVGGFDETLCYEDYDMWLRLAEQFEFAHSHKIGTKYRVVENSLSHRFHSDRKIQLAKANLRIYEKCLNSKKLEARLLPVVLERIHFYAKALHDERAQGRHQALFTALKYDFRIRTFLLLILSMLYIPVRAEKKMISLYQRMKNAAKK